MQVKDSNNESLTAFNLGWDYSRYGLSVPDDAPADFCDGYRCDSQRQTKKLNSDKFTRKWLQLRYGAMKRGKYFSSEVTPDYLKRLMPYDGRCPVTLEPLTFSEVKSSDWSIDRIDNTRGYERGNIVVLSVAANRAKGNRSLQELRDLANSPTAPSELSPEQWQRMANLLMPAGLSNGATPRPIEFLTGEPLARGVPMSVTAILQQSLGSCAALICALPQEAKSDAGVLVTAVQKSTCRTKEQNRAFKKLWFAVMRRAKNVGPYTVHEIWAAWRVQRLAAIWLKLIGPKGLREAYDHFGLGRNDRSPVVPPGQSSG